MTPVRTSSASRFGVVGFLLLRLCLASASLVRLLGSGALPMRSAFSRHIDSARNEAGGSFYFNPMSHSPSSSSYPIGVVLTCPFSCALRKHSHKEKKTNLAVQNSLR
jgi:hypothetical protein